MANKWLIDIIHHNADVCDSWFDIVDPIVAQMLTFMVIIVD